MAGVLLDTHALYWLARGTQSLEKNALTAIGRSQAERSLYVSAISGWELVLASRKGTVSQRPDFDGASPTRWFSDAVARLGARIVPIGTKIAFAAAEVVEHTGHRDPGDCYLIATARVRRIPIVTRDKVMLALAGTGYLETIPC